MFIKLLKSFINKKNYLFTKHLKITKVGSKSDHWTNTDIKCLEKVFITKLINFDNKTLNKMKKLIYKV